MAKVWHLLVPKGEFPHPSGVTQVIDDKAVSAMASAFDPARRILIDFDHYSDLTNDQREKVLAAGVQLPSEAAGWITSVRAGDKGLMGQIETTPVGAEKLANKQYRFLSPVWRRRDCDRIDGDRVRPLVLSKVGLTNEPNIAAIPELVANRGTERYIGPAVDIIANSETEGTEGMNYKTALCKMLGLDPEKATDDEITAAIGKASKSDEDMQAMENRAKSAEAERDALKGRAETAEAKVAATEKAAQKARVDAALKEYEPVITNRADIEASLTADYDGTIRTLKAVKIERLPNRADGNLPDGDDAAFAAKVKAQTDAVDQMCNRNPGMSRTAAYDALRVQGHEAFK